MPLPQQLAAEHLRVAPQQAPAVRLRPVVQHRSLVVRRVKAAILLPVVPMQPAERAQPVAPMVDQPVEGRRDVRVARRPRVASARARAVFLQPAALRRWSRQLRAASPPRAAHRQ